MTSLGIVLLVVGALAAIAEAHYPTHGVAGGVGLLVMAVGAVLTVSGAGAGVLLGLAAGLTLAAVGAGALTLSVRGGLAARQRRVRTGAEGIIGHLGEVRSWTDSRGSVSVDGALWHARRSASLDETEMAKLNAGDTVVVERVNGLTLSVRAAEEWELPQ
jgi:membrane-bound serine protease (ClpP class)